MVCGALACAESYLLAFDHISESLCGSKFYRPFLFDSGFGSLTFTSKFQSSHRCLASFVAHQSGKDLVQPIDSLAAAYSAGFEEHLRHFIDYLSKPAMGEQ